MKKRKIFLGVLLASAAIGLAACGGSKKPADNDSPNENDETPENHGTDEVKYAVTFNSNGGSNVASQQVVEGGKVTKPSNPTKAEDDTYTYEFAGWYKDSSLNTPFDFNTETVTGTLTLYAKWNPTAKPAAAQKFTVTFNTNGGSEVSSQEIDENGKVTRPSNPSKAEDESYTYEFVNWCTDSACNNVYDFNLEVTSSFTLYAKWNPVAKVAPEPDKFIVTFNTNGGTTIAPVQVVDGSKVSEPTAPSKAADQQYTYTFAGWYKDQACTEAFDFNTETITEAITLYAKWTETVNEYTVTYVTNGGTNVNEQSIAYGSKVTKPSNPSKAADAQYSYAFGGWYKDSGCTEAFDFDNETITGAITLYAKWNESVNEYAITFNSNGGTNVQSINVAYGSKVTMPSNPSKAADQQYSYTFAGWYKDQACTEAYDFNDSVTGALTLYAKWTETVNEYEVTFNAMGGTNVDAASVAYGSKATIPANPSKSATAQYTYTFAGWYKDQACTDSYDFNEAVTGAFTLYAKWTETLNQYEVTFDTNGGTTINAVSVAYGSKVSVPATPSKAADQQYTYAFAGWYEDSNLTNPYNFNTEITGAITLYAKWTETVNQYEITFNAMGGTAVDSQSVAYGSKATIPANPSKSATAQYTYTFAGWYKDQACTDSYDFNEAVTGAVTLYAKWTETVNKYDITFVSNGGTSVTAQSVAYGSKVSEPTAPTKAEDDNYTYEFAGWYVDSSLNTAYDFDTVVENAFSLYAKWTAIAKVAPEPDKFMVTFNTNGGTSVAVQQIVEGGYVERPADPSKEADQQYTYTFAGWYKDQACTQAFDFENDTVTAAITLYAKWAETVNEYSVTFVSNGGTNVNEQSIAYGAKASEPTAPTKAADAQYTYTFAGWYIDQACTQAYNFNLQITESITLYAKWNESVNYYEISFISNGGSAVSGQSIPYGSVAAEPSTPAKTADAQYTYTFAGWYTNEGLTQAYDFDTPVTGAVTLYAKWTETVNKYEVSFNTNGGTEVASQSIAYGSKATEPTEPTKEADAQYTYTFAGWYTDQACTAAYDFNTEVTAAITLYAKWTETTNQYVVVFNSNGGTAVNLEYVNYGGKVTEPTAPTKAADAQYTYTFGGWYSDQGLTQAYNFNTIVTGGFTLYAKWNTTTNEYTVTFNTNGGSAVTSQTVAYGATATQPTAPTKAATAEYTYTFAGWYTDQALTQAYDFSTTISGALTLYAKWTETTNQYEVTFNSNGGTAVTAVSVAYGSKVTEPTAPTKAADSSYTYEFAGWYTDQGLTQAYNFNTEVTGAFTLYAKWTATPIQQDENEMSIGFGEGLTPWATLEELAGTKKDSSDRDVLAGSVSYNGFTFPSNDKNRVDAANSTTPARYSTQKTVITIVMPSAGKIYLDGVWGSKSTGGYIYLKNGSTTVFTSSQFAVQETLDQEFSYSVDVEAGTYLLSSDATISLYKLYRKVDAVTVTYSTEHGSVAATKLEKGTKLSSLPELYEDGYVFGGWYTTSAYTQEFSIDNAITSNTTLYAKWTVYDPNNYVTVTFNTGLSSETIDPVVIDKNTKLSNVPTLTLDGYRFDGWYTDSSFNTAFNSNVNITQSITLYAKFVQLVTVTFKYEDNTTISSVVLDYNTYVDSTDIPTPKYIYGYTFDGWYNGNTKLNLDTTRITANMTIVAKYTEAAASTTVNVIDSGTSFETLYAEFTQYDTSTEYAAYVKLSSSSAYTKLDNQLIRKYKSADNSYNYYRVDAVGLKAGTYTLKIVPIVNGSEATAAQTEVSNLVVEAHDRSGFGFVNGSSSGAYNDDGTLKSNAQVVYVTNSNKDTVTLAGAVGVQNIIIAMKAQKTISTPVAIRFLGNIEDPQNMPNGDLYLDDVANLTVEGIGTDATMNGFGIVIKNSSNVEIRNLGFMNCNSKEGDDCGLQQANDHVWVHNCDFFYGDAGSDADQAKGDGALDTKKSSYVTHSYNHFWDNGKCNLQGMKDETTSNYITYHHNWYDHSDSRHPRIRTCTVHIYNNYFDGNAKYGVGVTMGASAFVESNYFRSTATMKPMLSSMQGTDALGDGTFSGETGGIIKAYNNTFDGNVSFISYQQNSTSFDAYVATSRNEQVPSTVKTVSGGTTYNNFDTASSMYSYTAQSPADAKATVIAKAGRVQGGDFEWSFNNSTEDSNYAVITALKTALTNYSSKLLSVQSLGEQSSGSGSGNTEPTGTTVADVISMIDALPAAANVTISDKDAINAAKAAFDSLSSSDQAQVTNSSKLSECVAALNTLLYSGAHTKTFDDGVTDSTGFFTITGNLKSGVASKTYDGVTYTTALKMESSTTITFTCSGTVTLTIITDSAAKRIKIDNTNYTTDSNGVYTTSLSSGSYTISKSDTMNVYALIVS